MKVWISLIVAFLSIHTLNAQYYYKDIILTQQTARQLGQFKLQKIRAVKVNSFDGNGMPVEDFEVSQTLNPGFTAITTTTKSAAAGEAELVSQFDEQGRLSKTVDTSDGASSTSIYQYNEKGQLTSFQNASVSAGQGREAEVHLWYYNTAGQPERMVKIKNDLDTTIIGFVIDEKGNVVEENASRKGQKLPSVYYYYDDQNRLTDIVRYNNKAQRLLPDYVFEYNDRGWLRSMIVVPEGSDDYQRWVYQYNEQGLKMKETCLNKKKQTLGRVEYVYN